MTMSVVAMATLRITMYSFLYSVPDKHPLRALNWQGSGPPPHSSHRYLHHTHGEVGEGVNHVSCLQYLDHNQRPPCADTSMSEVEAQTRQKEEGRRDDEEQR